MFLFQAEDGIRGGHVTGVQTCALPILDFLPKNLAEISGSAEALRSRLGEKLLAIARGGRQRDRRSLRPPESAPAATAPLPARRRWQKPPRVVVKIGRAHV